MSDIYQDRGQLDKAVASGEKGLALYPNNADSNMVFSFPLSVVGRHQEAIARVRKAMRLNPHHPPLYLFALGNAYMQAGRHEESIAVLKKHLQFHPDFILSHIVQTLNYSLLGREKEAREAAKEVLRIDPKFTIEGSTDFHHEEERKKRYLDTLRKAGLPD